MADHDSIVSSDKLEAIADAIREKTHKNNLMTLDEMPDEIASISGGGGNVPECGIVPTSWASNGFVLTADSYGNIMPCALSSGMGDYIYPDDSHDATLPGSIDISGGLVASNSEATGAQMYNYLQSVTFATTPESIGESAFNSQYRMVITSLPEGVKDICRDAFTNCYNLSISTIPASVESIAQSAFSYTNNPSYLVPYYDENSTYSVGDTSYYEGYIYTCVEDIDSAENFNYDHWTQGYFPGLIAEHAGAYENGDTVYYNSGYSYSVRTCCYVPKTLVAGWEDTYCPQVSSIFTLGESYTTGEVVVEYDSEYDTYEVYTCYSSIANATESPHYDSIHWISGYYPGLSGKYDPNVSYSIGDVIVTGEYDMYIHTCVAATTGEFDDNCWVSGYGPDILGLYDDTHTYSIGDIVGVIFSEAPEITTYTGSSPDGSGFIQGYYPNISVYDDQTAYGIGDIVYHDSDAGIYTCIAPTSAGETPSEYNTDYWVSGYYPGIMGVYDESVTYSVGDVVYNPNYNYVQTLVQEPEEVITLEFLFGYVPDLIEYYNSRHIYHPGDIVVYESDSGYGTTFFICLSPTDVTGAFDSSVWEQLFNSDTGIFVTSKLQFLGTPDSVDSYAFEYSGYNLILVPWSEGEGPYIQLDSHQYIIYDYHPEEDQNVND